MSKWVEEELEPGLRVSYGLKEVLASTKSKWQHVDLVDLQPFGRVLMIDGLVQSCQSDEFVYHESLVHPALLAHPDPQRVPAKPDADAYIRKMFTGGHSKNV